MGTHCLVNDRDCFGRGATRNDARNMICASSRGNEAISYPWLRGTKQSYWLKVSQRLLRAKRHSQWQVHVIARERSDLISVTARNEAVLLIKSKSEIASGEAPRAMTGPRHREERSDLLSVTARNESVSLIKVSQRLLRARRHSQWRLRHDLCVIAR